MASRIEPYVDWLVHEIDGFDDDADLYVEESDIA